jgi:hypothetical protein
MVACGGGSSVAPQSAAQPPAAQPDIALRVAAEPAANSFQTVELRARDVAELYQLSCRIAFDPSAVEPLQCSRGALVDDRAAFFSTTVADGYVPIAFTYHAGEAIATSAGSLAAIEFRILDDSIDPGYHLIDNEEYLIARDSAGQALTVALEVGQ